MCYFVMFFSKPKHLIHVIKMLINFLLMKWKSVKLFLYDKNNIIEYFHLLEKLLRDERARISM